MARKSLSPMQRLKVFEAAGGVCHICSQHIQVGERWDVEHVIPLALGGMDGGTNLKPTHALCHAGKTKTDVASNAKAKRSKAKIVLGIRKASTMPGGRGTKWKRKMNGEVVLR